jgi:hypothetical protein
MMGTSLFSQQSPRISFFSTKSLYLFAMGSFGIYDPYDEYYLELGADSATAFAPVIGAGFRLVNIRDRFFVNLEADYAKYKFDFDEYAANQEINALAIMVDFEWHLNRSPIAFTFGIGATLHHLYDLGYYNKYDEYIATGDDTLVAATMRFGIKISISRHFSLRSELRWSGEYYGDSYFSYYWREYYYNYYDHSEFNFISSALCFGLEYHL